MDNVSYSADTKQFDVFFETNYDKFRTYCKNYSISEDVFHDSFIKIRERVSVSGFKDTGMITYCINSFVNTNLNTKKLSSNKNTVNIVDNHGEEIGINYNVVENILQDIELENDNILSREQQAQHIVSYLFKFLQHEIKCDDFEMMVFKMYYLSRTKMSYEKISKILGMNKNRITLTIRKIKKQINDEFINYLKKHN